MESVSVSPQQQQSKRKRLSRRSGKLDSNTDLVETHAAPFKNVNRVGVAVVSFNDPPAASCTSDIGQMC